MTGMVIYETSPSPIVLITDNKDKIEMANMQYKTISRQIENEDTTTCTIGTDQSTSLDEGDGSDTSICQTNDLILYQKSPKARNLL